MDWPKVKCACGHLVTSDKAVLVCHDCRRTPSARLEAERAVIEAAKDDLENLASDLEECGRLAHIEAAEQRTYKSLGAQARKILANLAPQGKEDGK